VFEEKGEPGDKKKQGVGPSPSGTLRGRAAEKGLTHGEIHAEMGDHKKREKRAKTILGSCYTVFTDRKTGRWKRAGRWRIQSVRKVTSSSYDSGPWKNTNFQKGEGEKATMLDKSSSFISAG